MRHSEKMINLLKSNSKGFTLIELVLTVIAIGIFGAITANILGNASKVYDATLKKQKFVSEARHSFFRLNRDFNLQTWAMNDDISNPKSLNIDDLDNDLVQREREVLIDQAMSSGKPKEIMDKIVEGKIKRFLSEVSLLSQNFVKDPEITIQEHLERQSANIISFSRLKVGEGIEVEAKDFADEVAEQLK